MILWNAPLFCKAVPLFLVESGWPHCTSRMSVGVWIILGLWVFSFSHFICLFLCLCVWVYDYYWVFPLTASNYLTGGGLRKELRELHWDYNKRPPPATPPAPALNIVREGVESWRAKAELGGGVDNLLLIFKSLDGGNREFLMKESRNSWWKKAKPKLVWGCCFVELGIEEGEAVFLFHANLFIQEILFIYLIWQFIWRGGREPGASNICSDQESFCETLSSFPAGNDLFTWYVS